MVAARASSSDAEASYEKNAIFSAWLIRRIGASGSFAAVTGLRSMPLAMMLAPSDTSAIGVGAGAGAATGAGGAGAGCGGGWTAAS